MTWQTSQGVDERRKIERAIVDALNGGEPAQPYRPVSGVPGAQPLPAPVVSTPALVEHPIVGHQTLAYDCIPDELVKP